MKDLKKHGLRIFLLLNCVALALAARSYVLEFESFHREWNNSIFDIFTLDMITDGKRQLFNGSMVTAVPVNEFKMNAVTWLIRKNGRKRKLIDITVDGCKFLANRLGSSNQIAYLLLQTVRSTVPNLPLSCPVKKGHDVLIDKFYIDSEKFPPFLPEIEFEVQVSMTCNTAQAYQLKIHGAIISKEKKKILTKSFVNA